MINNYRKYPNLILAANLYLKVLFANGNCNELSITESNPLSLTFQS